jgi:hypothetical protein
MYDRVREKIMWDAKISRACANFLSDVDLKPGAAQSGGGINRKQQHQIRFVDSNYRQWSVCNVDVVTRGLVRGSLTRQGTSPIGVLDLEYEWCRYREFTTGMSTLTLFDVMIPEQVCAGLPADRYRLCDLVDFSRYKRWFFIRANPKVRSIRNVIRMRVDDRGKRHPCPGILVTMKDEWSRSNWAYWSHEGGYIDVMA